MNKDTKLKLFEIFKAGFITASLNSPCSVAESFEKYLATKEPKKEKYKCLKCGLNTAEKHPDICGWDGYCTNCGIIAQNQVGEESVDSEEIREIEDLRIFYNAYKP